MNERVRNSISATLAAALMLMCQLGWAQQIYKWVDEDGVVHYGESVPPGVEGAEQMNVAPSPPPPAAVQRPAAEPAAPARASSVRPAQPAAGAAAATPQPEAMSLEELDKACEDAREASIAPLRTAAIEECKAKPRADPAYCERYYSTFGDAVAIRPGEVTPRMFEDLPACVVAQEERRRRAR